ncbi:hypothetical protein F5B20DRAFT_593157 [Whalleya microplaca]|nr:hypothetical protein F5B20DRAFT_593157 [Whalleya microplaca]
MASPEPPASDAAPDVVYTYWFNRVDQIEWAFIGMDYEYENEGYTSVQLYFADKIYKDMIEAIGGISTQIARNDAHDGIQGLFHQAIQLLGQSLEFAKEAGDSLKASVPALREHLNKLTNAPFISLAKEITEHILGMYSLIDEHISGAEQVWSGGDITSTKEFEDTTKEFQSLTRWKAEHDSTRRTLIARSHSLLQQALESLGLNSNLVQVPTTLFDSEKRPTYVDYPCGSDEFLYGLGRRPGVLSLKEQLGGTLTDDEKAQIHEASNRQAPAPAAIAPVLQSYTMNIDNVEADFEDLYNDAQILDVKKKPDLARLVTPTYENRQDTMAKYKKDFRAKLKIYRRKFKPEEFNPTADYTQLVIDIDTEIMLLRDEAVTKGARLTSNNALKEARVAAFKLKYLRTLLVKLALGAEPPPTAAEKTQALWDRLDDWILYETTWNQADQKLINDQRIRAVNKDFANSSIMGRNANIARWRGFQDGLDNGAPPFNTPGVDEEPEGDAGDDDVPPSAWDLLSAILEPSLPSRTVYVNERFEQRRENFWRAASRARALNRPAPDEPDPRPQSTLGNSLADGGPPDLDELPFDTVYDKLVLMIVVTHWRCLQVEKLYF